MVQNGEEEVESIYDESILPKSPLIVPNSTNNTLNEVDHISPFLEINSALAPQNDVNQTPPVVRKDLRIVSKFWANEEVVLRKEKRFGQLIIKET